MNKKDLERAKYLMDKIDELERIKQEFRDNFIRIDENSTKEEIYEMFEFIMSRDNYLLIDVLGKVQKRIDDQIVEIKDDIKCLLR